MKVKPCAHLHDRPEKEATSMAEPVGSCKGLNGKYTDRTTALCSGNRVLSVTSSCILSNEHLGVPSKRHIAHLLPSNALGCVASLPNSASR